MEMRLVDVQKNSLAREGEESQHSIRVQWRRRRGFRMETGLKQFRGRGSVYYDIDTGRRAGADVESFLSDAVEWSAWKGHKGGSDVWHKI